MSDVQTLFGENRAVSAFNELRTKIDALDETATYPVTGGFDHIIGAMESYGATMQDTSEGSDISKEWALKDVHMRANLAYILIPADAGERCTHSFYLALLDGDETVDTATAENLFGPVMA